MEIISNKWSSSPVLDRSVKALGKWAKHFVGSLQTRNHAKEKELASRLDDLNRDGLVEDVSSCNEQLSELYKQDEIFWRQRSNDLWLKAGDKNSRFFRNATSTRKRTNTIDQIISRDGVWVEGSPIYGLGLCGIL